MLNLGYKKMYVSRCTVSGGISLIRTLVSGRQCIASRLLYVTQQSLLHCHQLQGWLTAASRQFLWKVLGFMQEFVQLCVMGWQCMLAA